MPFDQQAISQAFQSALGRAPTQAEIAFLQPYMEHDQINPYQIGQYLQGTPEAQQTRLGQQQTQFGSVLAQNNGQILSQAADAANASFAQNGRQFSSGQGNAVLQAGQQLAAQQSPMLANYYAQGQQGLNNQYGQVGMGSLSRAYDLQDSATAWGRQMDLYNRQHDDAQNALRSQTTRNLQGALIGLPGSIMNSFASAYGAQAGKSAFQPQPQPQSPNGKI